MKKMIAMIAVMNTLSVAAFAYETQNATSYSGPSGGVISGSTELSGTSVVRMRVVATDEVVQEAMEAVRTSDTQNISSELSAVISELRAKMAKDGASNLSNIDLLRMIAASRYLK